MFPDFILHKQQDAAIWVNRRWADRDFIERLADADKLFAEPGAEIIKDQRKIKVCRIHIRVGGTLRSIYLKRYNAFSLRYKLASPLIRSGAFHALEGAAILNAAKVPIATPVAAVENRRHGALTKSFFLSEEISGGKTADAFWRDELKNATGKEGRTWRRGFLAQLAKLFVALHGAQIYHSDLKDANILVLDQPGDPSVTCFLLDLECVRQVVRLSLRRRHKNLAQLSRTLGPLLRGPEQLFFLKCYLGSAFAEREHRRSMIAGIARQTRRLDLRHARRARRAGIGISIDD